MRALVLVLLAGIASASAAAAAESEFVPREGQPQPRIRLVLTFDDGPSNERFDELGRGASGLSNTPTERVLDVLRAEGISAAFFVLTGPDRMFGGTVQPKGETELGFEELRREVREGHVLGCHWGGRYGSQLRKHTASLSLPAYDSDGDGIVDRVTDPGNALESDLLQCMRRGAEAYAAEGLAGERPALVRPPLWTYLEGDRDARPAYAALGLHMVLADARLPDGAVRWAAEWFGFWLVRQVRQAVRTGNPDVVIALHDVNRRSARSLPKLIGRIRQGLADEGLEEHRDWKFTTNPDEVLAVLGRRTW
ncbi:MAG TPA: polysaccharide deacetylase family protein [Myxococcota bacterium]|nr:polysaccharide deacetylase family protein [Myxococcota bacterium]